MTCEWAEGNLSAYLDDALDPQLRKDVGAHIEQCARCQALAEEFRRNDHLLATTPQVAPSDELRNNIFESPAYAALVRERDGETASASPSDSPGRVAPRRAPLYARTLIPAAAALTLALGGALLFRQGLLPFGAQTAHHNQIHTIGAPGSFNLPLSAGPRLVFLNGGALWSVAEYAPGDASGAPGAPQRLTATSVNVVAWSVSPLDASDGGARIAYVDGHTGALHIVHSDGQADVIIGYVAPTHTPSAAFWSAAAGHAALAGLAWSPDATQLAYLAGATNGGSQVHVYSLNSSSGVTVATSEEAIFQPTWSADSHALAFGTTSGGAPALGIWRGAGQAVMTTPASPDDVHASVAQIAWSGARLTWTTTRGGSTVGVYALQSGSASATRLIATDATYDAADFTSAHGGVWLLAGNGALSEVRLSSGGVTQAAGLTGTASHVVWSPDGASAVVVANGAIALWSDANGLTTLAQGAASLSSPVWSHDSAAFVVTQGQQVTVYRASDGSSTQIAQLTGDSGAVTLAWAADERNLAIAVGQGTLMVATNGARQTLLTSRLADGAALSWSIAR